MLLHFVEISYYIMRRYYISQQFFITSCVGIALRNDFLLRFVQVLHCATIFYYIMRRYNISQRFCITLAVGITFRNVYYIMRFNTREKVISDLCSGRDFRKGSSRIGYWIIFEKAYIGKDIAIQNNQNRLFLFIIAYRERTVTRGKTFES